jgi:hypothetical protein
MRTRVAVVVVGLLVVVGLPLAGTLARRGAPPRCDFDGQDIEPAYRVRVVDRAGRSYQFCCPHCARLWLARREDGADAVYVTDEASGEEIDARAAHFVRSTVVTNPVTRNRLRAFRDRPAAEDHVRAHGGWVLAAGENPFRHDPDR